MKGIKAKIDDGKSSKVAKKTTKRQTKKEEKVEEEVYQFIEYIDKEVHLKSSVVDQFDKFEKDVKAVDNELMLFELKRENYEKDIELMKAKIQLIERDKRDVDTAIFHKKTEKKNIRTLQAEYRSKICRELGEGVTSFGYHPDTLKVELQKSP